LLTNGRKLRADRGWGTRLFSHKQLSHGRKMFTGTFSDIQAKTQESAWASILSGMPPF
jgi:hypothetical protein